MLTTSRWWAPILSLLILMVAAPAPAPAGADTPAGVDRSGRWLAPRVDVARLLEQDRRQRPGPTRVGLPLKTDLTPANSGAWDRLPGGDRVWRLELRSEGALWVVLGFDTFRLLPGAELRAYDLAQREVLGPFTERDVREHGELWFPPIAGDALVVELRWPEELRGVEPDLRLGTVSHGYRPWGGIGEAQAATLGEPAACNVDVNCPQGADWQDEKRGVVQLLIDGGFVCSGSLINNTALDCTPYVLTASHCYEKSGGSATGTSFLFNFERTGCGQGIAPTSQTIMTGSTLIAFLPSSQSDFTLLRLNQDPPAEYNAYFNGWSNSPLPASASFSLHHPDGPKKISQDEDPLIDGQPFPGFGPDHWRVTEWEHGTTEGGSSGGPLFDPDHRIVGQLHGAADLPACNGTNPGSGWAEFGKLALSWTGGGGPPSRLSDWLDPLATGVTALDGIDADDCSAAAPALSYESHGIDDDLGNRDGAADPGDIFRMPVRLFNRRALPATAVTGTLSTADPRVRLLGDEVTWPDFAQLESNDSESPHFVIDLGRDVGCGESIPFVLTVGAAEQPDPWQSGFTVKTGTPGQLFADDMESGAGGWTVASLGGSVPWVQSTARSYSPDHSWFIEDTTAVIDSVLVMETLANLPAEARMRFAHFMRSEISIDGGVLEYSVDGGPWMDAGGLITRGGYDSTLAAGTGSALGGRAAWSGEFGDFREVEVELSGLAGSDLSLRWRFATDLFHQPQAVIEGWYVDDVVLEGGDSSCSDPHFRLYPGSICRGDRIQGPGVRPYICGGSPARLESTGATRLFSGERRRDR